jgi:uncharacterized protein
MDSRILTTMKIDVREIPEEGLYFRGEVSRDIFELEDETIKPAGPLQYDFHVSLVSEAVLVRGRIFAQFLATCVRCLEPVPLRIALEDCIFHLPISSDGTVDLTESVREDILLALPVYPHCENGTPSKQCPLHGCFEEPEGLGEESREAPPGGRNSWSTLEGFKPST